MACELTIHDSGEFRVLILLGNLSILVSYLQNNKSRARIQAKNLALVICCIDATTRTGVQWFMALVECNGARRPTLIKGVAMQERDRAVEGFMTKVEWLLWKLVGTAAAIE
jgi:hypothetical protein